MPDILRYVREVQRIMFGILSALIFLLFAHGAHAYEVCSGVWIEGDELEFSDTEVRLMCGDPENPAYAVVPAYQAEYFLRGFLQGRAYLNPAFEITDQGLRVALGEESVITELSATSEIPEESHSMEKRLWPRFKKEALTPSALNQLEEEALSLLRQNSYACAEVKSEAEALSGSVLLRLLKLNSYSFGEVQRESIPGVYDEALVRFYPMRPEQDFDERKLALTEKRFLRSFVVQGTYFRERCEDETFTLSQQFLLGPPRTLRYGAGASTEVGPMARVRWSHHRYGPMASQLDANLQASMITQSLGLSANMYFWRSEPRRSLLTTFELKREDQVDFEERSLTLKPHLQWTRDSRQYYWEWALGPTYNAGTFEAAGTSVTEYFSNVALEGRFRWMDHDYEFFDIHPEEGDQFTSAFDFRHPRLGFVDPLLKLETSYVRFRRLGFSGRGSAIAGIRLNAATTWVEDESTISQLPPSVKFYGGGSDDLRGFRLRSLPENSGLGALTKLGAKLEFRRTNLFKDNFEGYGFLDGSFFDEKSWTAGKSLYWSPGIGLRWLSPIGLVQSFVSRGYATAPRRDFGFLLFVGMGGTF